MFFTEGFWPIDLARKAAEEFQQGDKDGLTYRVVDFRNGFARIDVYDAKGEVVVRGFK